MFYLLGLQGSAYSFAIQVVVLADQSHRDAVVLQVDILVLEIVEQTLVIVLALLAVLQLTLIQVVGMYLPSQFGAAR